MSPNRPNVEAPNQGGPPGPEALYQQNLLQQVVHLKWDQGLREIFHDNNSLQKSDALITRWDKLQVD